ncbi:MAG: hypothetical protein EON58_10135 [Alphaproteobacteria bacterium]|nr:MAG: hypothetical protein EON58_10135 [Alphaproteobacteria bacterium]
MEQRDEDFWSGPEEDRGWAEGDAIMLTIDMPAPAFGSLDGFPLGDGRRLVAGLAKDGRHLVEILGPGGLKRTVLYPDTLPAAFDEVRGYPPAEIAPGLILEVDYAYAHLVLFDRPIGMVKRRDLAAAWRVEVD